eukprot:10595153-Alexandrium_andersonii.AAC.1
MGGARPPDHEFGIGTMLGLNYTAGSGAWADSSVPETAAMTSSAADNAPVVFRMAPLEPDPQSHLPRPTKPLP